jgi:hypothetical protein
MHIQSFLLLTADKIELFEKILEDDSLLYWNTQLHQEFSDTFTHSTCKNSIEKLKIAFGGGEKARDHIIE